MKRKESSPQRKGRTRVKRSAQGAACGKAEEEGDKMDVIVVAECTQGTNNTEALTEKQHRVVEKKEKEIDRKKKRLFDPKDVMPLNFDLESAYGKLVLEGAEKDDAKYYRDEVFHEDEQKEKTSEIQEAKQKGLYGLDEPDDPGFWPPVLYEAAGIKMPAYTHLSEKTSIEYFLFPFTWDQIGTDWTIAVMGKRRSGKTRFILSMLGNYMRPFFPRIVVFTKTKCSGEYSKHIPEAYIFEGFDRERLDKLFHMQKMYKDLRKQGKFHGNASLLIIIDDCLSDGFKYQKLVDEVFFEGRHLDICFVISTQDIKGINPACTSNTDLAVVFNVRSERDKEAVRTKFCDFFKNDDDMEALRNQATQKKWHFVAYDQHEPSRDPRFTMFCGRAPDPPPFVMGCKAWWKKNKKQLIAIVAEHPEELACLLETDNWGIVGEEEFNDVL